MTTTPQPQPNPLAAIIVYGKPTNPDLPQASWFRAEDKQAAKAAAVSLKFSVIELKTDADKALTVGVHEGVLKGSGRMIVGSVAPEVYRRIEDHARKGAPSASATTSASSVVAAGKQASEQNTNTTGAAAAKLTGKSDAAPAAAPPAPAPDPWDAIRIGSFVLAAYWNEEGLFEAFWPATVRRIENGEYVVEWRDGTGYSTRRLTRRYVCVPHPDFIASMA